MRARWLAIAIAAVCFVVGFGGHARALPPDPAARGLDVFLHAPDKAAPGTRFELDVEAFGFAVVTKAAPLPSATIEVGWDPETLGLGVATPTVATTTDADGRAHLAVDVPHGKPGPLSLLVSVRHGGHARTRAMTVTRVPAARVELHTADTRVVPTSTIAAWVRVVGTSDEPLADTGVVVSLLEGGVARHAQKARTDRGGMVMARVPIPRIDEPVWSWTLRAEADVPGAAPSQVELTPREETPGTPTLLAAWETPPAGVLPGDKVPFTIRLRDATGQPVIEHPMSYWIGARGVTPPKTDDDWKRLATHARSDGAGEVSGVKDAPTLVKSSGTALVLVARSEMEGRGLERTASVDVGVPAASATIVPEVPALVPGMVHRSMLTVVDGRGEGVAGTFAISGDGLATTVTTDARGEAEFAWSAPPGIGATRDAGACAGGVAAAVTVRATQPIEALRAQRDAFTQCVPVDRDAAGIARVEPNVARPGETVRLTLERPPHARGGGVSAIVRSPEHAQAVAAWLAPRADGSASAAVVVPNGAAPGPWDVSIAAPDGARRARVVGARLLVVPRTLPSIAVKRVGGRATPGGSVDVEIAISDGHGRGLPGAVSAIVVDAFGGGSANVGGLDTRTRLCGAIGADGERCAALLERDPKTDALRRSLLSGGGATLAPANDPGAHASEELKKSFALVLKSLEGAVFEAAKSPQTLIDVRRKENGRWGWNPELFTLVTDAMSEPPTTPGGERLALQDLVAVDPQVTFDVVARRVTRLKLFRVLAAVREVRASRGFDPDEPVFKDPNALLRRLVRAGAIPDDVLVDPWGGTIQFVKGNATPTPFLSVVRGFELRAPGPDGKAGTADDVRDPFERVVRSGTPYADAVDEDRLVDAKLDMAVGDETVRAWRELFEELTGSHVGDSFGAGGLGLQGTGSGGGGHGAGVGLGNVGTMGHGRGTFGISNGDAYWSPPIRTDAEGHARMTIPLGDAETTWRVAFVAVPDGLGPASTTLDVASELPLSARVEAGAAWVEGDVVETRVLVRNRTARPTRATIAATADGAAMLERGASGFAQTIDLPPRGARTAKVRVRATRAGAARLVVRTSAEGVPEDVLVHEWRVRPAGERRVLTRTAWIEDEGRLALQLDHGYRLDARPRLVLERGYDAAVEAALDALEPEHLASTEALADAVEAATRIERWATARATPQHRHLAEAAHDVAQRALGRYEAYAKLDEGSPGQGAAAFALRARVRLVTKTPSPTHPNEKEDACPPAPVADPVAVLEIEPAPTATTPPCWGALVSATTNELMSEMDPVRLARAVLALAERPHRAAVAAELADHLRLALRLQPSGDVMSAQALDGRAERALAYAALLRASTLGASPAAPEALFARIAALRDVNGGYGSSAATLAVVRALLASQLEGHGSSHVRVRAGGVDRAVDVPEAGIVSVPLPPGTLDAAVEVTGPGLVARLERPVLRLWSRPPPPQSSPVHVDIVWPAEARAGGTGTLRVVLRNGSFGPEEVDVRVPLPPGVALAASTKGTAQIQGVLALRQPVGTSGAIVEVPLRFGLAGSVHVPEASARVARAPTAPAFAPARTLVVR